MQSLSMWLLRGKDVTWQVQEGRGTGTQHGPKTGMLRSLYHGSLMQDSIWADPLDR